MDAARVVTGDRLPLVQLSSHLIMTEDCLVPIIEHQLPSPKPGSSPPGQGLRGQGCALLDKYSLRMIAERGLPVLPLSSVTSWRGAGKEISREADILAPIKLILP